MPLHRLPEALQSTIALSLRGQSSVAQIQLSPGSLGQIQIRLEHTSQGLIAHVVAEHPEAAQTLLGSSDELRRSLESSGTPVLQLDIQTSDGQGFAARQQFASAPSPGATPGTADDGSDVSDSAQSPIPTGTPAGSLVDVLA